MYSKPTIVITTIVSMGVLAVAIAMTIVVVFCCLLWLGRQIRSNPDPQVIQVQRSFPCALLGLMCASVRLEVIPSPLS